MCEATPICGSWDFASGTSGWTAETGSQGNALVPGSLTTTSSAPAGGGPALVVGYDSTPLGGAFATGIVTLDGPPLCASGLSLSGHTVSAQVFLSGPAVPANLGSIEVSANNLGFGALAAGAGEATEVAGQWITLSGPLDSTSFTTVSLSVSLAAAWTGKIYIKNVQVQ
jgi:hypothetical protein